MQKKIDYTALSKLISGSGWDDVIDQDNAETCTANFVASLTNMIESCTVCISKICNGKIRLKPWTIDSLVKSI